MRRALVVALIAIGGCARHEPAPADRTRASSPTDSTPLDEMGRMMLAPTRIDPVFLCQVDHDNEDRPRSFAQLGPALKPGGRVVIANSLSHLAAVEKATLALGWLELERWQRVDGFFGRSYRIST